MSLVLLLLLSVFAQEIKIDSSTRDQYESVEKTTEKSEFQAEVTDLLDILINLLHLIKEPFCAN